MKKKIGSKEQVLIKYEKLYDIDDVIFFSSRLLNKSNKDEIEREKGIMSNLYTGNFKIPYDNREFNSSEQLLFYLNIKRWAKRVGFSDEEIQSRIDYLMSCDNGKLVKNAPRSRNFYENIVTRKRKLLGHELTLIDGWKNQYFILRLKYKYCKEFRDVLEKYKDKYWCENSDKPDAKYSIAGVIWDEKLQKLRGCNIVGRIMRRVYNEREIIMGES